MHLELKFAAKSLRQRDLEKQVWHQQVAVILKPKGAYEWTAGSAASLEQGVVFLTQGLSVGARLCQWSEGKRERRGGKGPGDMKLVQWRRSREC